MTRGIIKAVLDKVLWTSKASEDNKKMLADALIEAETGRGGVYECFHCGEQAVI